MAGIRGIKRAVSLHTSSVQLSKYGQSSLLLAFDGTRYAEVQNLCIRAQVADFLDVEHLASRSSYAAITNLS